MSTPAAEGRLLAAVPALLLLPAPAQLVERGPIDYLTLDYLAEITMSILQKQKKRDSRVGYAVDFVGAVERVLKACVEAARQQLRAEAKKRGATLAVITSTAMRQTFPPQIALRATLYEIRPRN